MIEGISFFFHELAIEGGRECYFAIFRFVADRVTDDSDLSDGSVAA